MNETTKRPTKNQTAAETYAARKADIETLLEMIQRALETHAEGVEKGQMNWGHPGDLGYIRERLKEALQFFLFKKFGNSEEETAQYIEGLLAEMREEE